MNDSIKNIIASYFELYSLGSVQIESYNFFIIELLPNIIQSKEINIKDAYQTFKVKFSNVKKFLREYDFSTQR